MIPLQRIVKRLDSIGVTATDSDLLKSAKNLMVYLAVLMSLGGLIWGSLLSYLHLFTSALIPFSYILLSSINILLFSVHKRFSAARLYQIIISMLLPFLLQWQLGGYVASGCVMIWAVLGLFGSIILLYDGFVYQCLLLFLALTLTWFWLDPYFITQKPESMTAEISTVLLGLNLTLVISILFILAKLKVDKDIFVQNELVKLYQIREANLVSEKKIKTQLLDSENRYRNLVEQSKVLICTHDLDGNLLTVNKPGAAIIGYEPEEILKKNLSVFLPIEFHRDYQFYLEHIKQHKTFEGFMTIMTKLGGKRIFLFKNTLIQEGTAVPYVLGSAQDVTEWRKLEFKQKRIQDELQMIITSMDDFVVEFDEHACFKNLWCRDERKLFMPVSSFIGKTIAAAFSHAPEFAMEAQRLYDEVLTTGEIRTIEIEDVFSDVPQFYLARLNPIKEKGSKNLRCTALVTDITSRKLTEKALHDSFQTQTVLVENLEGGVLVEDESRHIQLVNERFCELFNIPQKPAQLMYADCSQTAEHVKHLFRNPEEFPARIKEILSEKTKVLNEQIYMADGRILERDFIPIRSNGKNKGQLWHYREITKRLEVQAELTRTKEILQQTSSISRVGGWEVDLILEKVYWSDITRAIHEVDPDFQPQLNSGVNFYKQGNSREQIAQAIYDSIHFGRPFDLQLQLTTAKGNETWVRAIGQAEFRDGKCVRIYGTFQDINFQKRFEESLRIAKEEAERANRLKTIFLGNLSHEVRTPLQGIQGFAEILENVNLSESKRTEYLDIIKRRTIDLQNIIDSLLDMASLETGEIKSFPVLINVYDFFQSTFLSLSEDLSLKSKEIEVSLENLLSTDVEIAVDIIHLKQVVINLMKNSIKFTNQGTVKLIVVEDRERITVTITDTGIGIPKEQQAYIFEPFRQAHEGLSRSKGGIGLGLSICKKLIELWGGTIELTSEPGRGSSFRFFIPRLANGE